MSRKININNVINFEPEKKRISGEKGEVILSASAALCFELLIDNIGELVTHSQLYEYAWQRFGMEPTSTSLYQNISTLRKSLKNSGLAEDIIRTMPRRGFILSPLTEIERVYPEKNVQENESGIKELTKDDVNLIRGSEKSNIQMDEPLLSVGIRHQCPVQSSKKLTLIAACVSGIIIGMLVYFVKDHFRDEVIFTSTPVLYRGCTVFSNRSNGFRSDEMLRLMEGVNLRCESNRYVYLTSYRYSDRVSLILCRNPLDDKSVSDCHSVYYIKNLLK